MKALSIRQPWAHLIIKGIKRIENRTWNTRYRGPILIHASQRCEPLEGIEYGYDLKLPARKDLPRGALVGVAYLQDVITESDDRFFVGPYGFVLTNAKEITPYAMKGKLGLFEVPEIRGFRGLA